MKEITRKQVEEGNLKLIGNIVEKSFIDHGTGGGKLLGIWSGNLESKPATKKLMKNFENLLLQEYKLKSVLNYCREEEQGIV